jgi:PAS domain S-box-containing protein
MEFSGPFDKTGQSRAIIDSAPVPIWVSGPDSGGIYFNKAWLGFTGRTMDEELGDGWIADVHPDDRAELDVCAKATQTRQPFWTEFRLRRHDGVYRWILDSASPRFAPDGRFLGYMGSCIDVTDRKEAEADLRRSEERLRFAVQNSPVMLYHCNRDLRYTWVANPHPPWSSERLLGRRDDELISPHSAADLIAFKQRVLDSGIGAREEVSVTTGGVVQTWDITAEPLVDDKNKVVGLTIAALDITAGKTAEERQRLLTAELDHRVRNTLAAIQSLVTLSARSGQSKEEYTLALQGRIDAYTRIYGFLASMQWQCVNLHQLTAGVTRTFGNSIASRFHVDGENFLLDPSAAISLNLILHELATNAVRYGAASLPNGRVSLTWEIRDGHFIMVWRESEGPAIPAQIRPGFGTRLIRQLLAKDLRATFQLEYPADGALLTASIPLKRLKVDNRAGDFFDMQPKPPDQALVDTPIGGLANARILLVEDDPLIGLEFQTALVDAGVETVGPMPDLHHSLIAIMGEGCRFDAAILDVNLRGESTLPLAQLLSERGVPYIFVSGYDLETALPAELRRAPKLQKPVTGTQLLAAIQTLIGTVGTRKTNGSGELQ